MRWLSLVVLLVFAGAASAANTYLTFTPYDSAQPHTISFYGAADPITLPVGTWGVDLASLGLSSFANFKVEDPNVGTIANGFFDGANWNIAFGGSFGEPPGGGGGGGGSGAGWPDGIPQLLDSESIFEAVTGVIALLAPLFVLFAIGLAACYLIWRFAFGKVSA